MRYLLNPKFVIPLVLGLAILGALLGFSDVGKVSAAIGRIRAESALAFIGLMVLYEAIRGVQWHVLLRAIGVKAPLEAEAFSFILGEATKSAPIGNYFQNYLLSRVEDEDFGRTSAATTLIVLSEVGWCIVAVVVIGIDGWTWLRPTIVTGLIVFGGLIIALRRVHVHPDTPNWLTRYAFVRMVLEEVQRFREGARALLRPRPLTVQALLCGSYLAVAAGAMYIAALGVDIHAVSYWQILAVYAFSLATGLIVPLPVDLGIVELGGLGALIALGVSRELALSLMLVNRLLSIGSAVLVALLSLPFLRGELREALQRRNTTSASSRG